MDRSQVITLISEAHEQDANGVWRDTGNYMTDETGAYVTDENGVRVRVSGTTEVFCQVDSVSRDEFYEAGRNGLNPEYRFTMFAYDYNGERIVQYNGETYSVYRTYLGRNDTIELYVQREGGTNGRN